MSFQTLPGEVLALVLLSQCDSTQLILQRRVSKQWKQVIEKDFDSYWISELRKLFSFSEDETKLLLKERSWFEVFFQISNIFYNKSALLQESNFELKCNVQPIATVPIRCIPTNFTFKNPFPFSLYLAYFKDFDESHSTSEWKLEGNMLSVQSAASKMITHVLMLDCYEIRSSQGYPMVKQKQTVTSFSSVYQIVIGKSFDLFVVPPLGKLSFKEFPFAYQEENPPNSVDFFLLRDLHATTYDSEYFTIEDIFPIITQKEEGYECNLVNPRRGNYVYRACQEVFARVIAKVPVKLEPVM